MDETATIKTGKVDKSTAEADIKIDKRVTLKVVKKGKTATRKADKTGKAKKQGKRFTLRVSPLYVVMAAAMLVFGQGYEILVYTAVVVLHELAHAEAANRLGYVLHGFKLMPYGAQLSGGFENIKRRDEIIIAAAGPAFNLLLAIPAVALWWLIPSSYYITELFVTANVFTAIFNLLPVFPLDGGRIFLAALSAKKPRNKAYKAVRITGFVFATILTGFFVLSLFYKINFSFAVAAVFMLVSSIIPDKNSYYQRLYSMAYTGERLKRGLAVREIMVDKDSTVLKLSRMLSGGHYTRFLITGEDLRVKMTLTETELEELSGRLSANDVIYNNKKLPAEFKHKQQGAAHNKIIKECDFAEKV